MGLLLDNDKDYQINLTKIKRSIFDINYHLKELCFKLGLIKLPQSGKGMIVSDWDCNFWCEVMVCGVI